MKSNQIDNKSKIHSIINTKKGIFITVTLPEISTNNLSLKEIFKKKDKYGSANTGKGKKALIEHTSINPNASPHVGRARNAIIGDSLTRLLRFEGYKTKAHYWVNDVGSNK